nr:cysteine-rich RLK (receptor-like protein kinase) 8 [Tanacetum cinerariifolium]
MHYQKLKCLWDEIDALEEPYMCTCNCVCANGRLNGAREGRKRLLQFLMGLDECFSNVRGQILRSNHYQMPQRPMLCSDKRKNKEKQPLPNISLLQSCQPLQIQGNSSLGAVEMEMGQPGTISDQGQLIWKPHRQMVKRELLQKQQHQMEHKMMMQSLLRWIHFKTNSTKSCLCYKIHKGNNKRIAHRLQSDGLYIIKPDNNIISPSPTASPQSPPTTVLSHS